MKKILALFLALVLFVTLAVFPSAAEVVQEAPTDGFRTAAENDVLALLFNETTTEIKVLNKKTGYYFSSSLSDKASYEGENRSFAYATKSILVINYYEITNENEGYVSSFIDAVDYGNYSFDYIENGVKIEFSFEYPELTVPMTVVLNDDSIKVSVLAENMKYDSNEFIIQSVSVLPYFGAAEQSVKGYVFLPDGSGGLMYFDRERTDQTYYEKPVYGDDAAAGLNEASDITLPVFGMCHGDDSFLAVIDGNAADSYIHAEGYTTQYPYTRAHVKFRTATSVSFELVEQNNMIVYEEGPVKANVLGVSYYFLSGKTCGFAGMAHKLKELTFGSEISEEALKPAVFVDLYASVKKIRSVWGLKFNYTCTLTSLSDAREIFDSLAEKGVDSVVARYNNFDKKDVSDKIINGFCWNSKLGKDAVETVKEFEEYGIDFYFGYENTQSYQKSLNPFHTLISAARDTSDSLIMYEKSGFSKSDNIMTPSSSDKESYLLNHKHFEKNLAKLKKSLVKNNVTNTAFSDLGRLLYSDFRFGAEKRADFENTAEKFFEGYTSGGNKLFLENPNYYAAKYADEIINLPTASSGQDLIDEDVPFLQLFYSGTVRYAAESVNLSADENNAFLKLLETGSMPAFSWIGRDTDLLTNTELEYLYSGNYSEWLNTAAEYYGAAQKVYEATEGTPLENRVKLSEGVFAAIYGNGAAVIVNYNSLDYRLKDGTEVKAGGYCIGKEDKL